MILALAQLNYRIGDFEGNTAKIIETIRAAKKNRADIVIFAELAVGGYPAKDLLRSEAFLKGCQQSLQQIANHCNDIACIIGMPTPNTTGQGKPLFNSAVFVANGEVQQTVNKSLLPDYDIFDEYRYFEPAKTTRCVHYRDKKIALTICEDLWNVSAPKLYAANPMGQLQEENPDFIINIAASPFSYNQLGERIAILQQQAKQSRVPLLYLNQVGAHTDVIFDGRSLVLSAQGDLVDVMAPFDEAVKYYQIEQAEIVALQTIINVQQPDETSLIHQALLLGLRDYFKKSGFKKAILGLSGGIDSAVVAALACEALGPENVMAVLLPSAYSSDHSIDDALGLVRNTGCLHEIIPIQPIAESFGQSMAHVFNDLPPDTTEENIQARIRGTLLMAMANKYGYILLNTSNKSEGAVGYGTLYGDMAGALGVIGDLYKTQVYQLATHINRNGEVIPLNTLIKPPSAELRLEQKDSDTLPEYGLLDAILFQYIENEKSAAHIAALGFDKTLVNRILSMVDRAEFKRFQSPPVLRISSKAFGSGRVMPLVANYP